MVQDDPICLNHCPPRASSTIPVSLLCEIFGKFKDFCDEDPESEDNIFTYSFCYEMAKFYKNEEERKTVANKMLSEYLKHSVQPIQLSGNRHTDGTVSYSGSIAYREVNVEYK